MSSAVGLFESLRRVAATTLALVYTRAELARVELGEAGHRLLTAVLLGVLGVLSLLGALGMLSAWLVLLLWPLVGAAALGLFALLYLVLGVGLLAWMQRRLEREPPLLAATLNELKRDADLLRGASDRTQPL